jgi:hypothetical protein
MIQIVAGNRPMPRPLLIPAGGGVGYLIAPQPPNAERPLDRREPPITEVACAPTTPGRRPALAPTQPRRRTCSPRSIPRVISRAEASPPAP